MILQSSRRGREAGVYKRVTFFPDGCNDPGLAETVSNLLSKPLPFNLSYKGGNWESSQLEVEPVGLENISLRF